MITDWERNPETMTHVTWPDSFDTILRQHVPLASGAALTPDAALADLGLDSLATVGLLIAVEEAYSVQFPDLDLTAETFATPRTLWATVSRLRAEAGA
ncbi:phosphopantetheine-binding protein [Streptomyces sp. CAU 1734]|uniref:phosphopantetheine-binding protein n=1 Tax=Streptomyces sp. CAU 1734 TaxID=3140360 RepID=UPI003260E522